MAYTGIVRFFSWEPAKNDWLKAHRNISFEVAALQVESGGLLDVLEHPNQDKYPGQRIFIIQIDNYAYLVPFRETAGNTNLITIIPSRKMTRKYLGRQYGET